MAIFSECCALRIADLRLVDLSHLIFWRSFFSLVAKSPYVRVPIFRSMMQGFEKLLVRFSNTTYRLVDLQFKRKE